MTEAARLQALRTLLLGRAPSWRTAAARAARLASKLLAASGASDSNAARDDAQLRQRLQRLLGGPAA